MNILLALILTNSLRKTPLTISPSLNMGAQWRAEELCGTNTFSHQDMASAFAGTAYNYRGENLAEGFPTLSETYAAWDASPEHYKNLVNPNFAYTGFGEACGIVVQEFGGYAN
jgi:uncharacterized protein YkwD